MRTPALLRIAYVVIALASTQEPAQAEAQSSIRLEYSAPKGCPDRAAMLAKVQARVGAPASEARWEAQSFAIVVEEGRSGMRGRITTRGQHGEVSSRDVTGTDCQEVVEALALVVAMALHPELGGAAQGDHAAPSDHAAPVGDTPAASEATPGGNTVPAVDPGTAANSAQPSANVTAQRTTPATKGSPDPSDPVGAPPEGSVPPTSARPTVEQAAQSAPRAPDDGPSRFQLRAMGHGAITAGYVSDAALGGGAQVGLAKGSWSDPGPALLVGFDALFGPKKHLTEGAAQLNWMLGNLALCPGGLHLTRGATILGCGRLDLGRVSAVGSGIANAHSERRFWADVGVAAELVWAPRRPWVFGLQIAALAPLTRYRFRFQPDSAIYQPPTVAVSGSIGAGIVFF